MRATVYLLGVFFILSRCTSKIGENETDSISQFKRPNILFCIADDATFKHMSAYGCEFVNTPNFDRVAQEGLLFANVSVLH